MQNRYVGDIGDYVKMAILRQLAQGKRLGVAWWLFPDERHNNDGGHRQYLNQPGEWKRFDSILFDALSRIDKENTRSVVALESLIPSAVFAREIVPCDVRPFSHRPVERNRWLRDTKLLFQDRDLIFLDPDNGIASTRLKATQRRAGKSVLMEDIVALRKSGQAIVVYHHHSRFKRGHLAELRHLACQLRETGFRVCGALHAKPRSPRAFFILDGDEELKTQAQKVSETCKQKIFWYPDTWLFSELPQCAATE